jgi:hypothetical protein
MTKSNATSGESFRQNQACLQSKKPIYPRFFASFALKNEDLSKKRPNPGFSEEFKDCVARSFSFERRPSIHH